MAKETIADNYFLWNILAHRFNYENMYKYFLDPMHEYDDQHGARTYAHKTNAHTTNAHTTNAHKTNAHTTNAHNTNGKRDICSQLFL